MKDGITLVTAFFPIGRGQWGQSARTNDQYMYYFSRWAKLQNDLIVFTTPMLAERICSLRQTLSPSSTRVIAIEDPREFDPDMLDLMEQTGKAYLPYAFYPEKAEFNNALYDYIMYCKFSCLERAATLASTERLAWIDFGFDHGGTFYQDESFFESTWSYSGFKKPVSLFSLSELDDRPISQLLQTSDTYIQGDCFTCKTSFASQLKQDATQQYLHILNCGYIDDDQVVLLMCLRNDPEHYEALPSDWFSQLLDYNDAQQPRKGTLYTDIPAPGFADRMRWRKFCIRYLSQEFKRLSRQMPQ